MGYDKNDSNKRINFLKKIAVGLAAVAGTTGFTYAATDSERAKNDLSKYSEDSRMVDYADKMDMKTANYIQAVEENIETYKKLTSKASLTEEDKIELDNVKQSIREAILSGNLGDFYLENVLKEKIKSAYSAEHVEVKYVENSVAEEYMEIDIYENKPTSKLDKPDIIINKNEMPREIKAAIGCITTFQEFAECKEDEIGDKSIEKTVNYFDGMKGFMNLNLMKTSDGKIGILKFEKNMER